PTESNAIQRPSGDHLGVPHPRRLVSCTADEPSRLLTQISRLPERSDINTSRRPSGESCGPSFRPLAAAITFGVLFPGPPSHINGSTPDERTIFWAAICPLARATEGCHVAVPVPSILVAAPPASGIIHKAGSPSLVDEKITLCPSADHVGGPMIAPCSLVNCR